MTLNNVQSVAKIMLLAVLLPILVVACNRAATQPPMYGVKIQYAQGQPLNFPDVTLEFVGKREAPISADYPQGMTFYDFKVYQGTQAKLISWSAGTGDIGPTLFELAGNSYALELAISTELGSLAEDELVLWQEAISATEAPTAIPGPTPVLPTPTASPPISITLDEPFSLSLNQYGRLESTELGVEFYEIVEDTRCPQQEICESEGWARITVYVWKTNIEPIEYGLNTDPAANKSAISYDEYPETSEPGIAPQDYRATFVVSK